MNGNSPLNKNAFRKKVTDCIEKYLSLSPLNSVTIGIYYKGEGFVFGDEDLKYDIGSVSKTYCAHLVLCLAEKGLIDLNKTVDTYLPLKKGRYPTVYELLTHRAGYWHLTPVEITLPRLAFHPYAKYNVYENLTRDDVIRCLNRRKRHKSNHPYAYSDFPYAVLAVLAETVTNTPFTALFEDFIKNSLRLTSTEICTESNRSVPAALGKKSTKYWVWKSNNPYVAGGGLVTDMKGMLNYLALQIESEAPFIVDAHRLCEGSISKRSKETMCIGWHSYKKSNQLWHVGGVGTFRTSVIFNRKRKIGVAVFGNAKGKSSANVHYLAKMLYSEIKAGKVSFCGNFNEP